MRAGTVYREFSLFSSLRTFISINVYFQLLALSLGNSFVKNSNDDQKSNKLNLEQISIYSNSILSSFLLVKCKSDLRRKQHCIYGIYIIILWMNGFISILNILCHHMNFYEIFVIAVIDGLEGTQLKYVPISNYVKLQWMKF